MKIIVIGGSGLIGSTLVTGGMRPWRRDPASGVDTVTGQGLAAESAAEVGHHPPSPLSQPLRLGITRRRRPPRQDPLR